MKNVAVISEFNPFHLGHAKLAHKIREELGEVTITAVMSSVFTQRGDPAIYDPYYRSQRALEGGYDLVLSLPFPYSISSAEYFARAGASIARGCGIFDYLCFGVENGNFSDLFEIAEITRGEDFKRILKDKSEGRRSHFTALAEAYFELTGKTLWNVSIKGPNDILAVEYIKALNGGGIVPIPIKRETDKYSAHGARLLILSGEDASDLCGYAPSKEYNDGKKANDFLFEYCKSGNLRDGFAFSSPGMIKYITESARESRDFSEWHKKLSTKKYTHTRLRRALLSSYAGVEKKDIGNPPEYTELFGYNERGRGLLRQIAKKGSIEIISVPSAAKKYDSFEFELDAKRLRECGTGKTDRDIISGKPVFIP